MKQPVYDQMICALVSLGGGMCFGLIYDFFKVFRLKIGKILFTALCDILVCAGGLALLFLLFMSVGGGEARIYIVISAALGAVIYFLTVGPYVLKLFTAAADKISNFLQVLAKPAGAAVKKLNNLAKKIKFLFQKACKWFTIRVNGGVCLQDDKANLRVYEEEQVHEAETGRHNNKSSHSRPRGVRGRKPHHAEGADGGSSGKKK